MVNITKEIFNALWSSFFCHCDEGTPWDNIYELILKKYGKYIDEDFSINDYENQLGEENK